MTFTEMEAELHGCIRYLVNTTADSNIIKISKFIITSLERHPLVSTNTKTCSFDSDLVMPTIAQDKDKDLL